MRRGILTGILVLVSVLGSAADIGNDPDAAFVAAARGVIARFAGAAFAEGLTLGRIPPAADGRPVYEVADGGRTIRASTPVAVCKGFYDEVRRRGAGLCTWSARRFDAAAYWGARADDGVNARAERDMNRTGEAGMAECQTVRRVVSPFRIHHYLNVCTYGYTTCFWDERRWLEELDWMALHGIDAPLLLNGAEEIGYRVWRRLGLSDADAAAFFPAPPYLSWFLMGNLAAGPGTCSARWRQRSVRIQKAVLARARELGMTPIVPAFGGSVPVALADGRPGIRLLDLAWADGCCASKFLTPDQPLFREIERLFVDEYEKEFGKVPYFLADSFNEMKLPWKGDEETREGLALCGANIAGGIADADPDATWAFQGWMFFHSPEAWTPDNLTALLAHVRKDRTLILDIAQECIRFAAAPGEESVRNWERYDGYRGFPWLWGVIPNFGGRCDLTGSLPFYANGHLEALASSQRGDLRGWGLDPEGIECNEVAFELAAEAGWRDTWCDLGAWLVNWGRCRWGAKVSADDLRAYWDNLLPARYASYKGHDTFVFQYGKFLRWPRIGRAGTPPEEMRRLRSALSVLERMDVDSTARTAWLADRAELSALIDCREADLALTDEFAAAAEGREAESARLKDRVRTLLRRADATLAAHPLLRLDRQESFAAHAGETAGDRQAFVEAVRRISTRWLDDGDVLADYAARVWSGLLAPYYLERLERVWQVRPQGREVIEKAMRDLTEAFVRRPVETSGK